jgi:hypothetical protein
MNHIFSTISSKYQGETMFCFACVATVFGYILGINRIIDAVISKHSDEKRLKVIQMLNKYTQTNFGEIAELLASNNIILPLIEKNISSDSLGGNQYDNCIKNDKPHAINDGSNDNNDNSINDAAITRHEEEKQEKQENQDDQIQYRETVSQSSTTSPLTLEEDYELVRKNENINHSKNKNNTKYFKWLNIF